jgi:FeS assembly protein SufD
MMNLALEHVNTLPAPTWNWLGVNDSNITMEIPEILPYQGETIGSEPPAGVTFSKQISLPLEIETGMGAEASKFAEAHRNCGLAITVSAGAHVEQPVFLTYRIDGSNPAVVDVNTIDAGEGSEITVVISYFSQEKIHGFHGSLTKLYAHKNAVIHLVQVQLLNEDSLHFDDIGAFAEENGEINLVQAELGAKYAFSGCKTRLQGRNSRFNLDTIYFGDHDRSVDINYVAEHIGKKTHSEMNVNGALLDESRKIFRGTIDFVRGAKQAVGHEKEYNLLFSPNVRNRTAPLILCAEEDVEGQHASTTGKIDENKLFYLMSRGLDELTAKKLVIEAQFQPATDKIPDAKLRSAISEFVKERLNEIESIS